MGALLIYEGRRVSKAKLNDLLVLVLMGSEKLRPVKSVSVSGTTREEHEDEKTPPHRWSYGLS